MVATLAPGNANWAKQASLIVAVWSQADLDCRTPDGRDYYQFDTGMASALLMLAATEKNLVAHPIAGFDPQAARQVLALPDGVRVITLIIVGGHTQEISSALADWQVKAEKERSARMAFEAFASIV
jgi:nitroreductase